MAAIKPDEPSPELDLAIDLQGAIEQHGIEAVAKVWAYAKELLPVMVAVVWLEELKGLATLHGVERAQVPDAVSLLGYLRKSGNEHSAWLAAQIVREHCQNAQNFVAAVTTAFSTPDPPH